MGIIPRDPHPEHMLGDMLGDWTLPLGFVEIGRKLLEFPQNLAVISTNPRRSPRRFCASWEEEGEVVPGSTLTQPLGGLRRFR